MDAGSIGYWLAAAAFLALAAVAVVLWRSRALCLWVALGALASGIWALVHAQGGAAPPALQYLAELVRYAGWIGVMLVMLGQPYLVNAPAARPLLKAVGVGLGVALVVMVLAALIHVLPLPEVFAGLVVLRHPLPYLVMAVLAAMLVEQLYRNTHPDRRWAIKPLCIGLAAVFVYDIYLYADGTLFRGLQVPLWDARGFINLLVVPLLALSTVRSRSVSQPISVSRQLLFHSVVLVGSGVYLLLMAGAGYYIRYVGGTWGSVLQAAFLFGALLLLIAFLLSGAARARLKVVLSKHLLRYRYDYRSEWLRFIDTLSTNDVEQSLRQRAIIALAEIMDSPQGLLFSRGEDGRLRLTESWNFGEPDTLVEPEDGPLADFLQRTEWVVDLKEYRANPELYHGLDIPHWLHNVQRAWLIVPMMQLERLQGFVILGEPRAPRQLNWEDHDLLKTAGRQLASYIGLLDATDALTESRQFEAYNRLSAYVVHDLKNVSAQLGLVVGNAERHAGNPEFVADAMRTVANAKARMDRILGHLRRGGDEASRQLERFPLRDALDEVVDRCRRAHPVPVLAGQPDGLVLTGSRESFVTAVEHLVQNAQEATPDDGVVTLAVRGGPGETVLTIEDTGSGMDGAFVRERLFRPFQTTKGNAGMGIGVFEAREVARRMGGDLTVVSQPARGTCFSMQLPGAEPRANVLTDGSETTGEGLGRSRSQVAHH